MSHHQDLLDQASTLVKLDPRRPKKVNLRRAISSAYYAVFHLLIDAATRRMVRRKDPEGLRQVLSRAFDHGEMKETSRSFAAGNPKAGIASALGGVPLSADLQAIAEAFVLLQVARHQADYDLSRTFSRQEAQDFVDRARDAFAKWDAIADSLEADVYLMALLIQRRTRG